MSSGKLKALQDVLERGIGTEVAVLTDTSGLRSGLRTFFADLTANQGPVFTIVPTGLRRHRVGMRFGSFALPVLQQMQGADAERLTVARSLLQQLGSMESVELAFVPAQGFEDWFVTGPDFGVDITIRNVDEPASDAAVVRTAETVVVPLMAAMAELIGYDEAEPAEYDFEGRITHSTVIRRERSPRNRLLCLSIHGEKCAACGLNPDDRYGEAGAIIEVHHLEPVSNLAEPRPYDPRTDLVPLCPNCHRAVHTRRPHPYTPEELQKIIGHAA